ncbi:hypothetical protein PPEP_a2764 [Pseudoalteromonas peptidolytica F12-50-A1]|uniref:HTH araC/xylS-type domain-containing protein n=2 Tax=Pseudoalteromonas TaxID=53246 RepID=A0A8I0MVK9_9GAMM|nr:hypothetical protein [Pseudoalteromonas peptidolytica F12-50-A1]GEK09617.1 hypothetical protein PPE03_18660 [Pseudoalteromonas peptidolytica]
MYRPEGEIANYVQAVWFAQTSLQGEAWLPSDGANGIIIPISGEVWLNNNRVTAPFYIQPTATKSVKVFYSEATCFCGIRFKPAGFAFLEAVNHPLVDPCKIATMVESLQSHASFELLLTLLHPMLSVQVPQHHSALYTQTLLSHIAKLTPLDEAYTQTPIGKRQLERKVKLHCGITPKHLARIYRARQARQRLKENPNINLAQLALECDYADQAHLIREFKSIMQITPAKYKKLLQASTVT